MKIVVTNFLKDYQGKPILQQGGKGKLDLRTVISTAINTLGAPNEKPMSAEDKNKAFQISIKVWQKKEIDLTLDDRKFIKDKVGAVYNPLIYGRVCEILEK